MSEHQAQADTPDQMTVVDPLDATDSTIRGTNPMSAYAAELAAALAEAPEDELQGESPALEEDADDQSESETASPEEAEEPEEQISDEEAEEAEEEPEAKAKDRFRFKDPEDRKVAAVAKAMGVSLAEAVQIIAGQNPTKHQEAEPEARESVADVTAAIKELQALKREKLADLQFDEHAKLDEQIDDLRDKRDDLKAYEAEKKSSANQKDAEKFYSDYAENEAKTIKLYPSAADLKSELSKEIARLDKQMQELGDPLYHSPAKPFELAKKAAVRLGIAMTHPDEVPVSRKVTSNRPIQPASGNARTTATAPAVRQEEAIDKIRTMNDYEKLVASLTS